MIKLSRNALGAAAMLALAAGLGGCVERTITIATDRPGMLVTLNDQEIGRSPITVPFKWYGDYDVRITYEENVGTPDKPEIKRYYLHTHHKTTTPWFENIPMDLIAELMPATFKDEQAWGFAVPEVNPRTDDTPRGVRGRLIKLGFACAPEGDWNPDLASALRDFQTSWHVDPSGEFNESTKQALKEAEFIQRAQQLKAQMEATGGAPK